ncbi:hypothetical protein PG985_000397 [Apiospora marii]|uniref:Aldos-2-ulose dehydratase/isomerase (AUDH) Cupin domain-containing protein n=1 Tax=Apiospora marii TaxID=335849 RepID=A0ABR1R1Z1_9PEZI
MPTFWENEALISLRNPSATKNAITAPFIPRLGEIADYAISVKVYPRGASLPISKGDGLKVLFGSLTFPKENGGDGGMAGLKPEYADAHDNSGEYDEFPRGGFDWSLMRQLEGHGGLGDRDSDGRPERTNMKVDTVRYPWHKWESGDQMGDVEVWMAIEFDPWVVDQAVENGQQTQITMG